jgi:signal transduction histidine kinase
MQERLRELEATRSQFLATASHELRTPVASLQAMLELASQDLDAVPAEIDDARAQVERAEAQSRRLGELAADLLDLTRLDTGIDLREEPVELGEICRAVVAEFALRTAGTEERLEFDHSADSVWANADPSAVARVARILIDNALRYSPADTPVKIDVRRNGQGVELAVTDSGPGIPEDERDVIFERFRRGREVDGGTGFGLGLAIGRGLAARMHGDLQLDASDGGARFVLRLPSVGAAVPG